MPTPVLLAQLSDLHIGANENGVDPVPHLEAVVEAVRSLPNRVDAVLVSGDLTDDGAEAGYRMARELLERSRSPAPRPARQPRRPRPPARGFRPARRGERAGPLLGRRRRAAARRLRLQRPRPGPRPLRRRAAALARRGAAGAARAPDAAGAAPPAARHRDRGVGRDQPRAGAARAARRGCRAAPAAAGDRRRPPAPRRRFRSGRRAGPRRPQHLPAGAPRLRDRRRRAGAAPRLCPARVARRRAGLAGRNGAALGRARRAV